MDREELVRRLMTVFLVEADEHVQGLEQGILALEERPGESPAPEIVKEIFRAAHSLKGAARAVSQEAIEKTCHVLEDILGRLRDGQQPLTGPLITTLLEGVDGLKGAIALLREGNELAGGPLDGLPERLREAAGRAADADPPAPPPQRPPRETEAPAAPASPPPRPKARPAAGAAASPTIRVAASRLDELLARSGEVLVASRRVAARRDELEGLLDRWQDLRPELGAARLPERLRAQLGELGPLLEGFANRLGEDVVVLREAARPLRDDVHRVRLQPFASACEGLERAVRDVAREQGKQVELVIEGDQLELDRSVAEALRAPLLHLVRNAVDHGLETPEERSTAGKPSAGRLRIAARMAGGRVEVLVEDDGRGVDLDAVRSRAAARGRAVPADPDRLVDLLFEPGFSTSARVTDVSGRGVGLDVVRSRVTALHGELIVETTRGSGTRFRILVPLTSTTVRALVVRAAGELVAVLSDSVVQLLPPEVLSTLEGASVLARGDELLPVASLAEVLGWEASRAPGLVMVLESAGRRAALLIDEAIGERELVVSELGPRLQGLPFVVAATLLESGSLALILAADELVRGAGARPRAVPSAAPAAQAARLLIVDDSLTVRSLQRSILESAGYLVVAAADGEEGWELLQEHAIDLVISDVEMPRLDGFGLVERIRAHAEFGKLPVILLTALGSDEHRRRGLEVRADAYLVKAAFDQTELLQVVGQLLGRGA